MFTFYVESPDMDSCCLCFENIREAKINEVGVRTKEILFDTLGVEVNLDAGKRICWRCLTICTAFYTFQKDVMLGIKHEFESCLLCGSTESLLELLDHSLAFQTFFHTISNPQEKACEDCLNKVTSFYNFYEVFTKHRDYVGVETVLEEKNESEEILTEVQAFICSICHTVLSSKKNLEGHLKLVHNSKRRQCDLCDKTFSKISSLKRHVDKFHNKILPTCSDCGETFAKEHLLYRHIHDAHTSDEFKCSHCNRRFQTESKLADHVKKQRCQRPGYKSTVVRKDVQREKNFECNACHEAFTTLNSLRRHTRILHGKVKRYVCSTCEGLYNTRVGLIDHKKICKGISKQQQQQQETVDEYLCGKCDGSFMDRDVLLEHQKLCSTDAYKRKKEYLRIKNEKIVEVDGRFVCLVCHASFSRRQHCSEHYNVKHGRCTKFYCDCCNIGFSRKSDLRGHLLRKVEIEHRFKAGAVLDCEACACKFWCRSDVVAHRSKCRKRNGAKVQVHG